MIDRILIRLPQWNYLFPAISVAHNYISQQFWQIKQKTKDTQLKFVIEVEDESHLFFTSMFPRMDLIVRESNEVNRGDWDCVIDMREGHRAFQIAWPNQMHIVDAWGAMFGANPQKLPTLGPLSLKTKEPTYDFLLDTAVGHELPVARFLREAGLSMKSFPVTEQRACKQFYLVADARVYIGFRSGTTYMAATMGKGCIEVWPTDLPLWFMTKPPGENYHPIIGNGIMDVRTLLAEIEKMVPALQKAA